MMISSEDGVVMDPRAERDALGAVPAIAFLPPSPDAYLLAELISHGSDLSEAAGALELALDAGEESHLWMPLTMHAATAYIRPFIHSNVRRRLDQIAEFPGVPASLESVHATVRTYRNTTVAHSQSDLASPLPVALLKDDGTFQRVIGITAAHPMPLVLAMQLRNLIEEVVTLVEAMTKPVVARLEETHAGTDAATIANWPKPQVRHHLDEDFTASNRRTQHPQMGLYWHGERSDSQRTLSGRGEDRVVQCTERRCPARQSAAVVLSCRY